MPLPIYGFVRGDTLGLVVIAHEEETIRDVALKLQLAADVRVPLTAGARVFYNGRELDASMTVADAGLEALTRLDVVPVPEQA